MPDANEPAEADNDEAGKPAESGEDAAPAAAKPADAKPAEPKSAEPKPAEPKPAEPKASNEEDAESGRGQRKVRNYLLQPPFQVQLVIYNCVLALAFAGAVIGVLWRVQTRLAYRMDLVGVPDGLKDSLESAMGDSAVYLLALGLIFMVACAAVTILLTHRLVGPAYAFRRQINELASGRYDARIRLRENDAFMEVAEDLNRLAETLQREHGGLSASGTILTMD